MPEHALARLCAALLPRRIARELFEPAWCDLRIAAARRGRARSRPARLAAAALDALHVLLLLADCWRLAIPELPALLREARRRPRPRSRAETAMILLSDLRHAARRLRREPAFTLAAVLTLALGVGANLTVFAVVEAVLLRPLPYPEAERLVVLNHRDQRTGLTKPDIAMRDFVDLRERQRVFESFGRYGEFQNTMTVESGEPLQVAGLALSAGAAQALRLRPAFGRALRPEDSHPGAGRVALLGHALWRTRFGGDSAVVGRTLRIGSADWLVVGVAAPEFRFPVDAPTEVLLSLPEPASTPGRRTGGWTNAVGRLRPGVTVEQAGAQVDELSRQLAREYPESNAGAQYFPLTLRDAFVGSARTALVLLLGAVTVVLLVACTNVANLFLARALGRRREMALRMALGAGRGRLVAQVLAESLVLASLAGIVGIGVAHWGARALVTLLPDAARIGGVEGARTDGTVLAAAVVLVLGTAVAFGVLSALGMRGEALAPSLYGATRTTMSRATKRLTSGLVVAEIAFAVVLLMGAGLVLRSFVGLLGVDPGFRYDRTMTIQIGLPAGRYDSVSAREGFYAAAYARLRAIPGVESVGAGQVVPLTGNNWTAPLERADRPLPEGERPPEVGWQMADRGYFTTLGIPLVAGRLFDERDRPDGASVAIVSEAVVRRHFPDGNAVGRQILVGRNRAEIVGVVGDVRRGGLRDEPRADLYYPIEQLRPEQMVLFVRTAGEPEGALPAMLAAIREVEPATIVIESQSFARIATESVRVTHLLLWLLGAFALVALLLAVVGIYGVMSYLVRQQTREIGTRLALGASRGGILLLVLRHGAAIAAIGTAIGLGVGLAAARLLESALYGVSTADPLVLAAATALLVVTALAACWLPARRAAALDPARTLAEQ